MILLKRCLIIIGSLLLLTVIAVLGVFGVFFLGPSESARDRLTLSLLETSAMKWVPGLYLRDELVAQIRASNFVIETSDITDASLVIAMGIQDSEADSEWADYPDEIRIETVRGATYRGHVMLIRDPSRIYAGTSSNFQSGVPGIKIHDIARREGAVAAINGGAFVDEGGVGIGDLPIGLVFSKGALLWGEEDKVVSSVIGFTNDNVLVVGNMSPKTAREMGMRDAMNFGPILVMNGEPLQIQGLSGSLNPRTAIGQRADGVVIFLCVEGRMASSLGATHADLIEIMLRYGAVNAGNLDGGTSTAMLYNGELVNTHSSLYGPRRIPTYFLVKPKGET